MAEIEWRPFAAMQPEREYAAMASYLPLLQVRTIGKMMRYARQTREQLARSHGLIGYSVRAQLLRKRFWTLSVWDDLGAPYEFVRAAGCARSRPYGDHLSSTRCRTAQ